MSSENILKRARLIAPDADPEQTLRRAAYLQMRGWLDRVGQVVGMGLVALLMFQVLSPTDPTDAGPFKRSGLRLLTDHETGCQYLRSGATVWPRLSADGRHLCRREALR